MASIAIVDDNPQSCEYFRRLLESAGHRAVAILGSEKALRILVDLRPDLLILDVKLPGMSGIDLLRLLRGNPSLQPLPVVMLSGVNDLEVQAEAFALGARDYIVKGLDWDAMLARIEGHLPGRPAGAS